MSPTASLRAKAVSPIKTQKSLMNSSLNLASPRLSSPTTDSPVFKRGGTFSNQKRGLLNKTLKEFDNQPQPMSPALQGRFQKLEQTSELSRKTANEMIETLKDKKDLEQKVSTLENRIKRLKFEDDVMLKKINATSEKTNKIMSYKKRRQVHLLEKELRANNKNKFVEKQREEFNQERSSRQESIRGSQDEMLRFKYDVGQYMRHQNEEGSTRKRQNEIARNEKNLLTIARVRSAERELQDVRQEKEDANRNELIRNYVEKMKVEKNRTGGLGSRLENLARLEDELFSKLSQTQALHKAKYNELEKTFNLKVTSSALEEANGVSVLKTKSDTTGLRPTNKSLGVMKFATAHALTKVVHHEEVGQEDEEEAHEEKHVEEEAAEGEEEEVVEGEEEAVEGEEAAVEEEEEVAEGEEQAVEAEEEEEVVEGEEEVVEGEEEVEYEEEEVEA